MFIKCMYVIIDFTNLSTFPISDCGQQFSQTDHRFVTDSPTLKLINSVET